MGIDEKSYSEKRDFIRMKISAPLNATLSADSDTIEGMCRDLSGGGLQVEASSAFPVGTELEVEVSSGHGHKPTLKARAKIVRTEATADNNNVMGLEIMQVLS